MLSWSPAAARVGLWQICHAIDLDFHSRLNQRRLDGSSRRDSAGKKRRVHFIHRGKIGSLGEKHGAFHNVRHGSSAANENVLNVLEHKAGFVPHVAEGKFVGAWIDRPLTGNVEELSRAHNLRIRPLGTGRALHREPFDLGWHAISYAPQSTRSRIPMSMNASPVFH